MTMTAESAKPVTASDPILAIRGLTVTIGGAAKPVRALDGVDLSLGRGEVVALLGESGSGKSVTLRSILRLHPPTRSRIDGTIHVEGVDVTSLGGRALEAFRGKTVSMVFQEPMLAMDPVYTVGRQITEAVRKHERCSQAEAQARALEMLTLVRIPSPERRLQAYPHEMSGGMRQRAMIALALASKPRILLADEPTTALDATVQLQVLLLLRDLQRELGLSMIFVTHDISVAVEVADRIAAEEGLSVGVVNARFIKPLDRHTLLSHAAVIPLLVTREDHVVAGGFGSAVLEALQEADCVTPVERIG